MLCSERSKVTRRGPVSSVLLPAVLERVVFNASQHSQIIDPDTVPPAVKDLQPKGKQTHYCVRFFGGTDHAWLQAKDISRLLPHEIDASLGSGAKGKTALLKAAYEIAKDPDAWFEAQDNAAEEEPMDEDDEVDELDEETGKGKSKKAAASKKRKREAEPKKVGFYFSFVALRNLCS